MTDFLKVALMGAIQGVTEFLPISSSGHLVLAKHFLKLNSPALSLEIYLHAGTLLSVILYYHKKILSLILGFFRGEKSSVFYMLWVCCATIPTGIFYSLFKHKFEAASENVFLVACFICVTGLLLLSLYFVDRKRNGCRRFFCGDKVAAASLPPSNSTKYGDRDVAATLFEMSSRLDTFTKNPKKNAFCPKKSPAPIGFIRAFLIGIGQAIAIFPGISRSGTTICVARWTGLKPAEAAEFSFLMSLPVILGALLLEIVHADSSVLNSEISLGALIFGMTVATVVGCLAIGTFIKMLKQGMFWMFGIYCLVAGVVAMALL